VIAKPKKINKKEMKEDSLVTGYYKSREFYEEYQKQIFITLGAIAVIVVAIGLYVNRMETQNAEAAAAIAKVIPLYEQGSYVEAAEGREGTDILGFKKIADEYGGTDQGEIARVYAANSLYYSGKYDEALEYYKDYSGDDPLFVSTALAGEAAITEMNKDNEKAGSLYEKAARVTQENPMNAYYYLHAAINYRKAGETDKASKLYKLLKDEYKTAQETREAEKYLAGLE